MSESKYESVSRLENLINGHQMDLEKVQSDLKDQASMLKAAFENDAAYLEAHKDAQEATKKKKVEKDRIIEDPAIAVLNAKVQDLRSQVKEERQALSDYLSQYFQESGLRQITGADGEIRDIVTSVRLVKKRD
jgi:hypothetical protein